MDFAKRFSDAKVSFNSDRIFDVSIVNISFQANFDPNLITPSEYVEILAKVLRLLIHTCNRPNSLPSGGPPSNDIPRLHQPR